MKDTVRERIAKIMPDLDAAKARRDEIRKAIDDLDRLEATLDKLRRVETIAGLEMVVVRGQHRDQTEGRREFLSHLRDQCGLSPEAFANAIIRTLIMETIKRIGAARVELDDLIGEV